MVISTMTTVFFLILTIFLLNTGGVRSNEVFILKGNTCKDDVCIKEGHNGDFEPSKEETSAVKQMSQDFAYKNSSTNLVKIKYLNTNLEKALNIAPYKNSYVKKIVGESMVNEKFETLPNKLENALIDSSENDTELYNETIVTEVVTELTSTGKDVPEATTDLNIRDKTSTTPKLNTSTSQMPPTAYEIFLLRNFKQGKSICFCDLTLNQCDVNCCCDRDCSLSHFKVFTKCIDASPEHNENYCFNSNFIYQNNTSYKMTRNKGGLFCLIRDNLDSSFSYQTRSIITTLESFNKSLPENSYMFSYKSLNKFEFTSKDYQAGSPIWTVQGGEVKLFGIPAPSVGSLCLSQLNVRYLIDEETYCSYQRHLSDCGKPKERSIFDHLRDIRIISNPGFINKSNLIDPSKLCQEKACIGITSYLCQSTEEKSTCVKIQEKAKNLPKLSCRNSVTWIQYQIRHNGSGGILKVEAYVWMKNLSDEKQYMQKTEVKFFWWDSSPKIFKRSGNPGYITGKPILAGRKVYFTVNETSERREAIEMSYDPREWLSVPGSEKGICSSKLRTPINFRENSQYMCSIKLTKDYFGKEKCLELQKYIFEILIGDDIVNATKDNFFNKFVATFGNSKVEETGDWVQVVIDLFPIISSQTGFRSNYYHLICKNVITDLYIDIAYSNIGSFLRPQAKILGVSYRLGKHRDLIFDCETPDCESQWIDQYFKLSSIVNFVDLTKPALDAFAEPLTLEARLPHDFFYPFFSKSHNTVSLSTFVFVLSLSALL